MYCINCGVKLGDSEKKCPLCGVRVFHPDLPLPGGEALYPQGAYPPARSVSKHIHVIIAAVCLLAVLITLLCDVQLQDGVTWSGYAVGGIFVAYVCVLLPMWFHRPNPVIFVPCGFASVAVYLLYIDLATHGGWFLPFALPVVGALCLIVTTVVTLVRYVRRGYLYIFGGASIALGAFMPVMEFLIMYTFGLPRFIGWSLYPLAVFAVIGGLLIFLAICHPARQTMERKFFL